MNPLLDEVLNGCSIADLYVYRDSQEPNLFHYLPDRPTPETNAEEQPTLSLLSFEQMAILQFGVCWTATSDQLKQLQIWLENQYPEIDSHRLSPAPIAIQNVTLYLRNRTGENRILKTVSASNYSPYTALFNTTLNLEEKDLAIAAIMGHGEIITVSYQATLPIPISIEVKLTGDVQFDLEQLPQAPSLQDCLRQIEAAIVAGRLDQVQTGLKFNQTSKFIALVTKAEKMAQEKAAQVLQTMAKSRSSDQSNLNTIVTLSEMISIDLIQTSDISTWFPKQDGLNYIQTIG